MKKVGFLFAVLSVLVNFSCSKNNGGSPPPASDVNLKNGLLVYLDFNGVVADSSGNNNPAVIAGDGTLSYDEHGNENSAFSGDGGSGRVLVTNNGSIKFDTAFSASFDVMIWNLGIYAFLGAVDNTTGYGASFGVGTNIPGNSNLNFAIVDSSLGCDAINSTNNTRNLIPSFTIEPGSWYNIISIFHKDSTFTYINGKLIGSMVSSTSKVNYCSNSQVVVGNWVGSVGNGINGRMDEVRLYNRVLNADEIAELSKDFQ